MGTPSTHLGPLGSGYTIFAGGDTFSLTSYDSNWSVLDLLPGIFICTSGTRPSWGANQAGMHIFETDSRLKWFWDGAAWNRASPVGRLGYVKTNTTFACSTTWTPPSTGTLAQVLSVSVTVPAGNRMVMVVAEVPFVQSSNPGTTWLALENGSTLLNYWPANNSVSPLQGENGSFTVWDTPTAGSVTYKLMAASPTGAGANSTLQAATNSPISLAVVEV